MSTARASKRKRGNVIVRDNEMLNDRVLEFHLSGSRTFVTDSPSFVPTLIPPRSEPLAFAFALDDSQNGEEVDNVSEMVGNIQVSSRMHTHVIGEDNNLPFLAVRDEYGAELVRLDSRRGLPLRCRDCRASNASFRCRECIGGALYCQSCIVHRHQDQPLHWIETWTSTFFTPTSLRKLGLLVQLGHPYHEKCGLPTEVYPHFVIINSNGIHKLSVRFCGCRENYPHRIQLLRHGWWPATPKAPRTCTTIATLRTFLYLRHQAKMNAYDYYLALERMSDGYMLSQVPPRYESFRVCVREYAHVQTLKRAGRFNFPDGAAGTQEGELAIACRACPSPQINLPARWEEASPGMKFLYVLVLNMDANFRLKNRAHKNGQNDRPYGPGLAYFVEPKRYESHLRSYVHREEITTCAGFQALLLSNMKLVRGNVTTGVGGIACRHEFWRPSGLGNLQKGERYANMDWLFLSTIRCTTTMITIAYDIACQWFLNLFARIQVLDPKMRPRVPQSYINAKVGTFHIQAHESSCHAPWGLGYARGVGRSDGEGIERLWSILNGAAPSTKEMGPGARQDTLDSFCGFSNWKKHNQLPAKMLKDLVEALDQGTVHAEEFDAFDAVLRSNDSAKVDEWLNMVDTWYSDVTKKAPCPFTMPRNGETSLAEVKLRLAIEEERAVQEGRAANASVGPAGFILLLMQIEDLQDEIRLCVREHATPLQESALRERRTRVQKKLQQFYPLQAIYMPGLSRTINVENTEHVLAEDEKLCPPSSLTFNTRTQACTPGLVETERQLREGALYDYLNEVRRGLQTRGMLGHFKTKNLTGVAAHTRAQTSFKALNIRIKTSARRYRRSREALLALDPEGAWSTNLCELSDCDLRAMNERVITDHERMTRAALRRTLQLTPLPGHPAQDDVDDDFMVLEAVTTPASMGEGSRTLSWIWLTMTGLHETAFDMGDCARVEWAKSLARMERWREEVLLLVEEMRRVIAYTEYMRSWWTTLAESVDVADKTLAEGLRAYACERADYEDRFAARCSTEWRPVMVEAVRSRFGSELSWQGPPPLESSAPPASIMIEVLDDEGLGAFDLA